MTTTKQLVKFDFDLAVITALDAKYKGIQITDGKSYALVMAGLAEYRELRLTIDDMHKQLKKDILEAGRGLDGDKTRLKALLEPGENHLKEIRQVEDDRKAEIKEKKDRKERERIEGIQEKINNIRDLGIMLPNISAIVIEERLIIIKGQMLTQEVYQEFTVQAENAYNSAVTTLETALTERLQYEKEDAARKLEAERLEAQRRDQEAAQAKIDVAQKKIDDEKAKIKADKKAEQDRKDEFKVNALFSTGLMWDGEGYCFMDVNVHWTDVVILSDDEFNHFIDDIRSKITTRKEEEAAKIAKEAKDKVDLERIEKEEADAKKKARQEALRPDREKLFGFADELLTVDIPSVKSAKAKQIIFEANGRVNDLAADIKEQAKEL